MGSDLIVLVPSRGRPESLVRVANAWDETGAFADGAGLVFVIDSDDPTYGDYLENLRYLQNEYARPSCHVQPIINLMNDGPWQPMVSKLNRAAAMFAEQGHFALGFAGDDHLPRTKHWAAGYVEELSAVGTGIVYCRDGLQDERLPTQWAMTSDIVRALGCMVPAPVDHLFCDNAVRDLGRAGHCLSYMPAVLIEHMHPLAGKAPADPGYIRVNRPEQYRRDRAVYDVWREKTLPDQAALIRALKGSRHG